MPTAKRSLWQKTRAKLSKTYRNKLAASEQRAVEAVEKLQAQAAANAAAKAAAFKAQVDRKVAMIEAHVNLLRPRIGAIPTRTHSKKGGSKTRRIHHKKWP